MAIPWTINSTQQTVFAFFFFPFCKVMHSPTLGKCSLNTRVIFPVVTSWVIFLSVSHLSVGVTCPAQCCCLQPAVRTQGGTEAEGARPWIDGIVRWAESGARQSQTSAVAVAWLCGDVLALENHIKCCNDGVSVCLLWWMSCLEGFLSTSLLLMQLGDSVSCSFQWLHQICISEPQESSCAVTAHLAFCRA